MHCIALLLFSAKALVLLKKILGRNRSLVSMAASFLTVMLLLMNATRLITSSVFISMSDEDYYENYLSVMGAAGEYIPEKVGFPTLKRKITPDLIEHMENDTEHFYYVDFATGIQILYANYEPWIRPEEGLFSESYTYFGGCTIHHPAERAALIRNGADPDSPYKSLTNGNILSVDNWAYDIKLEYLRRYYNADVQVEQVGEIDGFPIWNYYIAQPESD